MGKFPTFFLLVLLATLAAATFGALHNQLSYSVGPTYFTELKFLQFNIADALPERIGASLVGIYASWWMGPIVGLPAFLYGLVAVPNPRSYLAAGIGAIFMVILLATVGALIGLLAGLIASNTTLLNSWIVLSDEPSRQGFQQAGLMHNATYVAGFAGLIAAFIPMRRARQIDMHTATKGSSNAT
jgi:hypothetical protein